MFNGIGVSRGFGIGDAQIWQRNQPEVAEITLPDTELDQEVERFHAAVEAARAQLRTVLDLIPSDTPGEIETFIESHLLML
ncbi:MAG: phosphoenolpyruvate--protein phosphotransferase, partial [Gammaproteobacteria bacterium]|nr:phosphoenolpyruvate--protein phosphotransferase [Gammaproteobacteria bacterium]